MKKIQTTFALLLLVLTALWWQASLDALSSASSFFPWRTLLIQYSGILGLGVMTAAMILAVRPTSLESRLGGLDKMYRLHKWLGIAGLVLSVMHWLLAKAPKWLVKAGLLERPERGKPAVQTEAIFQFLQSQRHLAEEIGEWAFYAVVVLIALALIKRFPYRHFFKTHRILAVVYLVLVFHSTVLMSFSYWPTPLGITMGVLMLTGSVAALISLFRRIGINRKAVGEIEQIERLDGVNVNAITIQLKSRWPGHEAGQFAFVSFDAKEGPHPFTISSAWHDDGKLLFLIKELGDYTRTLASSLKPGDEVEVVGPYGRFNFEGAARRQIWIGGGIGITPFVARMKSLATHPDGRLVDLYHTTADVDDAALAKLAEDAGAAGVRLQVLIDARDGRLSGERLRNEIPDWKTADVWFCGPAAFGEALRRDLLENGLPAGRFHQELFAMR